MRTRPAVGGSVPATGSPTTLRLPPAARAARLVLLLVLAVLFAAGTAVGNDHWWPFGPWRMFSTSTPPSGSVIAMRIEIQAGDDPGWRTAPLEVTSVGLNRAEVEGRVPQITADPGMLGTLARSHSRLRPDEPPWRAVRLVRDETLLAEGAPTGERRSTTLASWP